MYLDLYVWHVLVCSIIINCTYELSNTFWAICSRVFCILFKYTTCMRTYLHYFSQQFFVEYPLLHPCKRSSSWYFCAPNIPLEVLCIKYNPPNHSLDIILHIKRQARKKLSTELKMGLSTLIFSRFVFLYSI